MHDAGAALAANAGKIGAAMRDQGVNQSPVRVARGRMDDQAGGLVEHDQMRVLGDDIERHGLRLRGSGRRIGHDDGEILTRFDPVCGLDYRRAGRRQAPLFDQDFKAAAREARQMGRENPIDPPAGIGRGGFDCCARSDRLAHGRTMAQKTGAVKVEVATREWQDMKALKILVAGMGVLIALGLALLVYGLADGISGGAKDVKAFGDLELKLPPGCVIAAAEGLDGRLIVRTQGPMERGCQQVIMIDMATGEILGRILGDGSN